MARYSLQRRISLRKSEIMIGGTDANMTWATVVETCTLRATKPYHIRILDCNTICATSKLSHTYYLTHQRTLTCRLPTNGKGNFKLHFHNNIKKQRSNPFIQMRKLTSIL